MWTKSRRIIRDLCHSCYWWRGMFFCNSDDVCCSWLLHRTVECLLPNSDIGIMKILKEIQKNFCGMFLCVLRDVFSLRNQSPITSLHLFYQSFILFSRCLWFSMWGNSGPLDSPNDVFLLFLPLFFHSFFYLSVCSFLSFLAA